MKSPLRFLPLLSLAVFFPLSSYSATVTWSGASGGDWNTDANWGGAKPGSGDTALFNNSGATLSVTNGISDQNVAIIQFGTTSLGNVTIGSTSGNKITLTSGGSIALLNTISASRVETINAPLVLAGTSFTFNTAANSTTNSLVIGGTVSGSNAAATTLTLAAAGNNANGTISGLISDGASASVAIVKTTSGKWILTNDNNSFSGGVSINSGTLAVTSLGMTGQNSALGTNGTIKVGSQGSMTLLYQGGGDTTDKNFQLQGTNGMSVYSSGTGAITLQGTIATTGVGGVNNNLQIRGNFGTTATPNVISGTISDGSAALNIIKGDNNVWALSGNNTYTGTTTVNGGSLLIGTGGTAGTLGTGDVVLTAATSTLTFNRSNSIAATNNLSGLGVVNQSGSGTLTLSGTNTQTGATTINAGTLSVAVIGNGGSTSGNLSAATNAAANLVFNGGALQYTGATASTDRNFTINAGKTATFDVTTNNLTLAGNSTATNGALAKIGAGTLTLAGTNLYTGTTSVSEGTLVVNGSIAASSSVTLASGAHLSGTGTVSSVSLAGNNALSSSSTLTTSGITVSGTGNELTSGVVAGDTSVGPGAALSVLLGATLNGSITASGSVLANGTINGAITVADGGLLGGSGTITGAATIDSGATLSPGNSPGLLAFDSDLTLNGTTLLQIAGTERGSTYDAINIGGTLTYGGILSIVFSTNLGGGETFGLFAGSDGSSAPTNLGHATSVLLSGNGYNGELTRNGSIWSGSAGGLNFTFNEASGSLSAAAPIPEPSTYALLFGGVVLGGVLVARRRRSR